MWSIMQLYRISKFFDNSSLLVRCCCLRVRPTRGSDRMQHATIHRQILSSTAYSFDRCATVIIRAKYTIHYVSQFLTNVCGWTQCSPSENALAAARCYCGVPAHPLPHPPGSWDRRQLSGGGVCHTLWTVRLRWPWPRPQTLVLKNWLT